MNNLIYSDPFANMFKEMEALMNFDFSRSSGGLKKWIKRPHNLITNKDKDGKVTSFGLEVVYTPFKKNECKVQVLCKCCAIRIPTALTPWGSCRKKVR